MVGQENEQESTGMEPVLKVSYNVSSLFKTKLANGVS